jgi:metal-responsive CopG/Arc/MetJ family transcriptional regulator
VSNTTGKRVQIYIPADLVGKWDRLPRYERSAEIAKALRQLWGMEETTPKTTPPAKEKRGVISDKPRSDG